MLYSPSFSLKKNESKSSQELVEYNLNLKEKVDDISLDGFNGRQKFSLFFLYLEMECERNEGGDWNENIENTGI